MTSAQVVETSVNVSSNSPSQDYTHPDDRTLLNDIFHWLYSVVLPIVFCGKFIAIFVRSIVRLAIPEARSMRCDTTQKRAGLPNQWAGFDSQA